MLNDNVMYRHQAPNRREPNLVETESDKKRKGVSFHDDNGVNVRRKYDEEGDAEMLVVTFDPQYIGHDEWILQESYVEPIEVYPILHEPTLDANSNRRTQTRNWYQRR